jgi:hypothetical protein
MIPSLDPSRSSSAPPSNCTTSPTTSSSHTPRPLVGEGLGVRAKPDLRTIPPITASASIPRLARISTPPPPVGARQSNKRWSSRDAFFASCIETNGVLRPVSRPIPVGARLSLLSAAPDERAMPSITTVTLKPRRAHFKIRNSKFEIKGLTPKPDLLTANRRLHASHVSGNFQT